ncbi:hypothetical protein CN245_17935 [Sinorhizobium meliloti]|nr:hypothetical protein CN245_17935 [Sinorhizobium meliloti]
MAHHHREERREASKAKLVSSTVRMLVIQTIDFTNYRVCSIGDKAREFKCVRARALKTPGLAKRCSSQHRQHPISIKDVLRRDDDTHPKREDARRRDVQCSGSGNPSRLVGRWGLAEAVQ